MVGPAKKTLNPNPGEVQDDFTTAHPFSYIEASVPSVVARLLAPLDEAFAKKQTSVPLNFQWAVNIIGEKFFKIVLGKTRLVLRDNSPLYRYGKRAGLPVKILSWLAGDPATENLRILIDIPDSKVVRSPPIFYPPAKPAPLFVDPEVLNTVRLLKRPLEEAFNLRKATMTLTFRWAVKIIGDENFGYNYAQGRKVICRDAPLWIQREEAGMSKLVMDWLAGKPDTEELVVPIDLFDGSTCTDPSVSGY